MPTRSAIRSKPLFHALVFLWFAASAGLARASKAVAATYDPSQFSAGTPISATAWTQPGGGWWTVCARNGSPSALVLPRPLWGSNAVLLDSYAQAWTVAGNSATAYANVDWSCRVGLAGDKPQAWIFARWDGAYSGFLPLNAYYLRIFDQGGPHFEIGRWAYAQPYPKVSGALPGVDLKDFKARLVVSAQDISAEIDGKALGSFNDPHSVSGGVGMMAPPGTQAWFGRLAAKEGPTPPIPSATNTATGTATDVPGVAKATATPSPTARPAFLGAAGVKAGLCDPAYGGWPEQGSLGRSLDTLGYTTITAGSAKDWALVEDPAGGAPVAAMPPGDGWHFVRYSGPSDGYIDLRAHINAGQAQAKSAAVLFWNSKPWISDRPTLEANGYAVKIQAGSDLLLTKGINGFHQVIGYSTAVPRDFGGYDVEAVDNQSGITISIDGTPVIQVRDSQYPGGAWGFGGLGNILFSRVSVGGPACLPTNTPTATPQPSPTPPFVPSPCGTPFPAVWTRDLTPAATPVQTWEAGVLQEAMVLRIKGVYHMTYSGGWGYDGARPQAIGLKTSPDGTHWSAYGTDPILGQGFGGERLACGAAAQVKVGSEYRIYYKDGYGNIKYASSSDGYHYHSVRVAIPFNDLEDFGVQLHWNSGYYFDGAHWWAVVDALNTRNSARPKFFTLLYESADNAETFQFKAGPLFGPLQEEGSARTIFKVGDVYHLFHLVGYPSDIRHAASPDLYNWKLEGAQAMTYTSEEYGLVHVDQAADPSLFQMPDGSLKMLFSVVDNQEGKGVIGQATYPGNFDDLAGCVAPGGKKARRKDK